MPVRTSHQKAAVKIVLLLLESVPDRGFKIQGVKQLCMGTIWKIGIIAGGPDETVDGQGQPIAVLLELKGNVLLPGIMGPALLGSLDVFVFIVGWQAFQVNAKELGGIYFRVPLHQLDERFRGDLRFLELMIEVLGEPVESAERSFFEKRFLSLDEVLLIDNKGGEEQRPGDQKHDEFLQLFAGFQHGTLLVYRT